MSCTRTASYFNYLCFKFDQARLKFTLSNTFKADASTRSLFIRYVFMVYRYSRRCTGQWYGRYIRPFLSPGTAGDVPDSGTGGTSDHFCPQVQQEMYRTVVRAVHQTISVPRYSRRCNGQWYGRYIRPFLSPGTTGDVPDSGTGGTSDHFCPQVQQEMYRTVVRAVHQTRLKAERTTERRHRPVLVSQQRPPPKRSVHLYEANKLIEW